MYKKIVFSEVDSRIISAVKIIKSFSNVFFVVSDCKCSVKNDAYRVIDGEHQISKLTDQLMSNKIPFIVFDYAQFLNNVYSFSNKDLSQLLANKVFVLTLNKERNEDYILEYILNNTSVAINNDTNLSMIFAMELVKLGIADFPIAGAVEKSNCLIKSSLNILKLNKKYSRISSFFIMIPKAYHAHNKSKIK